MLWYFKKLKYLYLSIFIIGLITYVVLFGESNGKSILSFDTIDQSGRLENIPIVAWIFGWALCLNSFAKKKFNIINRILFDECNPVLYSESLKKLLNQKTLFKPHMGMLLLSYCRGLLESGKVNETLKLLKKINDFSKCRRTDEKIFYFYILFLTFIKNKDLPSATDTLTDMNRAIKISYLSSKMNEFYTNLNYRMQLLLNIEQGNLNKALEFFTNQLQASKTKFEQVNLNFTLGRIYLESGDINRAKEAFNFVIDNGNMLQKVADAKKYLEGIG